MATNSPSPNSSRSAPSPTSSPPPPHPSSPPPQPSPPPPRPSSGPPQPSSPPPQPSPPLLQSPPNTTATSPPPSSVSPSPPPPLVDSPPFSGENFRPLAPTSAPPPPASFPPPASPTLPPPTTSAPSPPPKPSSPPTPSSPPPSTAPPPPKDPPAISPSPRPPSTSPPPSSQTSNSPRPPMKDPPATSPSLPPPPPPPPPLSTSNPPTSPPPAKPNPPSSRPPTPSPENSSPPPKSKPPSSPPQPSKGPPQSPAPTSPTPPKPSPPPESPLSPEVSPPPPSPQPTKSSPTPPSPTPSPPSPPPSTSTPPPQSPPTETAKSPSPTSPTPPEPSPPHESPPPPEESPPSPTPPSLTPSPLSNSPPSPPPPRPSILNPTPQSPRTVHLSPPPPPQDVVSPPGKPATNSSSDDPREVSSSGGNGGLNTGIKIAMGLGLGLALLAVIAIALFFVRKRRKKNSRPNGGYVLPTSFKSSPQSDSGLLKSEAVASNFPSSSGSENLRSASKRGVLGNSTAWFTYKELVQATNGFSEQNLLGEGGFGSVYKGCLADGKEVAVKQLKIGGGQGEREFKAEVEIISRIHHRHLVSLAGYCIWESRRLLVYEYVPNNTLHFHLHGKGRPVMEWATRVKIAAGAARGIAYLHEDCHPRIIHRDIKSSNILLDNNFEARVSDFGLAKLALDADTHISTRVVGTFGYMAPEYVSSGKLTEKSDVFSFGVVLLELITGRRPVDTSQPVGEENLVEWARPLLNQALDAEELEGLADPRLNEEYVDSEMLQMFEVAAACVRHSAARRPRMGQVVRAFDSMAASDIMNGVPAGDSEICNLPPQSSEIQWFRRVAFANQDFSTDFFSSSNTLDKSRSDEDAVGGSYRS